MRQSLVVMLMVNDIEPFAANVALAARIVLVRPNFCHPIIFNQDFKPAVLGTQDTPGFMPFAHGNLLVKP
jgi:hypothetical protein